jgi:hypothetical protein
MWTHRYEEWTDLSCEALWPILADVARWPEVDHNIGRLDIAGPPGPGVPFTLKVRNGPALRFTIGAFEPPHRYSDICRMPLARMRTLHTLAPENGGTRIRVDIEIEGPLAPVWGLLVGRKHANGLPAQTQRLLAAARTRSTDDREMGQALAR